MLPIIGIGVILLADKLNFLVENDGTFRFVILMQYTTPSDILLGAITSLKSYTVSESLAILFLQHVFVTLCFSNVVLKSLLFQLI